MKRKNRLGGILVWVIMGWIVVEVSLCGLASADPMILREDLTPPKISIWSPLDNETFCVNEVQLNFTVEKVSQDSQTSVVHPTVYLSFSIVRSVGFELDGKRSDPIAVEYYYGKNNMTPFAYSINLTGLANGVHSLSAWASGTINLNSIGDDSAFWEKVLGTSPTLINGSSSTIHFIVEAASENPSESSITPTVTASPTPTSTPTSLTTQTPLTSPSASQQPAQSPKETDNSSFPFNAGLAAAAIVFAVVCVGIAVVFMRRRKRHLS